jgi:outer membrane receptor for ferrienterochelin and colicins
MRWPFLFLCLAVLPAAAQDAVLSGRVTDQRGEGIPYAHVIIQGTQQGAVAGEDGAFALRLPAGEYRVTASAVGFRRITITVSLPQSGATVEIRLPDEALASREIVVTASRREQDAGRVSSSVSVLTGREIENRHTPSLDHVLRLLPGVQLADNQVSIRGSSGFSYNTGSRVILLVDGMPLIGPESDGIPFDALPIDQIERVEVLKGPGSALYGGGALGGVIHVITRDFPDEAETTIRAHAGAYQPFRHASWRDRFDGGNVPQTLGGFHIAHARSFRPDLGMWLAVTGTGDEGHLEASRQRHLQGFWKIGWQPRSAVNLTLMGGHLSRQRDVFLYWNGLRDPLSPGSLSLGSQEALGKSHERSSQWMVFPAMTHTISANAFYHLRGRFYRAAFRPTHPDGTPKPIEEATIGYRAGLEWQFNWSPRASSFLTAGVSGDYLAARSDFFRQRDGSPFQSAQPEAAAFLQWEESLGGRLTITPGLRLDFYGRTEAESDLHLSPKAAAAWWIRDGLTARASVGSGFRVPGLAERFTDNRDFFPIVNNPDLRPETSLGYEGGLRWSADYPIRFVFDAAAFSTLYRGLIEPRFVPQHAAFQFVNLTRARITGTEARIDAFGPGGIDAQLGYTFLIPRDLSTGTPLQFRSNHLVQATITIPLTRTITAGVDARFASRPERVDSDFARFVPDAETMVPIRRVDLRLGADFGRFSSNLIVANVLDYYYVERPAIMAPPRHAVLQFRVRL